MPPASKAEYRRRCDLPDAEVSSITLRETTLADARKRGFDTRAFEEARLQRFKIRSNTGSETKEKRLKIYCQEARKLFFFLAGTQVDTQLQRAEQTNRRAGEAVLAAAGHNNSAAQVLESVAQMVQRARGEVAGSATAIIAAAHSVGTNTQTLADLPEQVNRALEAVCHSGPVWKSLMVGTSSRIELESDSDVDMPDANAPALALGDMAPLAASGSYRSALPLADSGPLTEAVNRLFEGNVTAAADPAPDIAFFEAWAAEEDAKWDTAESWAAEMWAGKSGTATAALCDAPDEIQADMDLIGDRVGGKFVDLLGGAEVLPAAPAQGTETVAQPPDTGEPATTGDAAAVAPAQEDEEKEEDEDQEEDVKENAKKIMATYTALAAAAGIAAGPDQEEEKKEETVAQPAAATGDAAAQEDEDSSSDSSSEEEEEKEEEKKEDREEDEEEDKEENPLAGAATATEPPAPAAVEPLAPATVEPLPPATGKDEEEEDEEEDEEENPPAGTATAAGATLAGDVAGSDDEGTAADTEDNEAVVPAPAARTKRPLELVDEKLKQACRRVKEVESQKESLQRDKNYLFGKLDTAESRVKTLEQKNKELEAELTSLRSQKTDLVETVAKLERSQQFKRLRTIPSGELEKE